MNMNNSKQKETTMELRLRSDSAIGIAPSFLPPAAPTRLREEFRALENLWTGSGQFRAFENLWRVSRVSQAAQEVFRAYELVELILLEATNSTVLRLQRTNKTFDHVIRRSVGLQQKLFFQAKPSKKDAEFKDAIWNPLLLHCMDNVEWDGRPPGKFQPMAHFGLRGSLLIERGARLSVPSTYIKHGLEESWRRMLFWQGLPRDFKLDYNYEFMSSPFKAKTTATAGEFWELEKSVIEMAAREAMEEHNDPHKFYSQDEWNCGDYSPSTVYVCFHGCGDCKRVQEA